MEVKQSMLGDKEWIALHWKLQGLGLALVTILSFNPKFFHYEEDLLFFLLLISVGVAIFQGVPFWVRSPIDLPLGLLVVWILLTLPFSIDPIYSFSEWRKVAGRILVFYWAMLVFQHQPRSELCWQVTQIVVLGAFVLSVLGIVEFIQKGGTLLERGQRALVFSGHSHWLATYLVMAGPFVVFLYIRTKGNWHKLFYGFVAFMLLIAEFLTYSRGGWLALASQGIGFGVLSGKIRNFVFFVLLGLGVLCGLFLVSQAGYLGGIFDKESVTDRFGCWSLGIQELSAHPFVGVGFGNDIFAKLYPGNPPGDCTGGHLHSSVLMFGMGSGAPALVLLVWVFFEIIRSLSRDTEIGIGKEVGRLKLAVALMALGYLVSMSFNYLFTGSLAYLFWILMAVGFSVLSIQEGSLSVKDKVDITR